MQATTEESGRQEEGLRSEIEIIRDFGEKLKIDDDLRDCDVEKEDFGGDSGEDEEEEDEEDEEFSFMCGGSIEAAITADDAFVDWKIKPIYPLFERDLVFSSIESEDSLENLPVTPPVKMVLVEIKEEEREERKSLAPGNDEAVGPVCEWSSRKVMEAPQQICKKSNSTGTSKIRRIIELVGRSNSDGRDAFIFLNKHHPQASSSAEPVPAPTAEKKTRKIVRKSRQSKTTPMSPHEVYLRSKAKQEVQRRSYLPYRTEFMGIFTNIHGGLSKNIHPF